MDERTPNGSLEKIFLGALFCSVALLRRSHPWAAAALLCACVLHMFLVRHREHKQQQDLWKYTNLTVRAAEYSARKCADVCLLLLGCGVVGSLCWYDGTPAEAAGMVALLAELAAVASFRVAFLDNHHTKAGGGTSTEEGWTSYALTDSFWSTHEQPQLRRAEGSSTQFSPTERILRRAEGSSTQFSSTERILRTELEQHIDQSGDALSGAGALELMALYRRERSTLQDVEGRVFVVRESRSASGHSPLACVAYATVIQNYDILDASGNWLPSPVKAILKTIHQLLGVHSPFRQTLVLMGFQWPFRSGVFFRANDKPEAHAQILQSLLKCVATTLSADVILLPCLVSSPLAQLLLPSSSSASSLSAFDLPPTYQADLRQFREQGERMKQKEQQEEQQQSEEKSVASCSPWSQYVRMLKLQYRRNIAKNNKVFYETSHSIHEAHSCARAEAERAAELTRNISDKRAASGETRMLIQPSASFFLSLNNDDDTSGCLRKFLSVTNPAGQTIATSVLFEFPSGRMQQVGGRRLGGLLTSDLKGLVHDEAKASHSYFVMLAHAIQIALRDGYDCVDFGPTTERPKLEVGCTPMPMTAGIWCRQPLLEWVMRLAGKSFTKRQSVGRPSLLKKSGSSSPRLSRSDNLQQSVETFTASTNNSVPVVAAATVENNNNVSALHSTTTVLTSASSLGGKKKEGRKLLRKQRRTGAATTGAVDQT